MNATEVLAQAVERHHPRLVMLCSFQKEESVLVDELVKLAPDARIVTIDTGVLFPETLATWRAFEQRFGVDIEIEDATGDWTGPEHCCGERKVAALERALGGVDAWITGIRREQSRRAPTRSRSSGTTSAGSGSSTRSTTGPRRTSGSGSSSATCRTTRCTTRATRRSAARPAPIPAAAARAAGRAWTRPSAGCTSDCDPWLILFGFGVGILVGTTGMGGGSLMTPLLILVFGIKPVVAVGTDLAYAAITKTAGGFLHFRKGTVQTSLALWLALGSCPGAVLGVILLERLGLDDILLPLIAGALLLTGALVLFRALMKQGADERDSCRSRPATRSPR